MNPTREFTIQRIIVALEPSRHSVAALETATQLAAALQAELLGLFVEDINLLRLAELPFARETRYLSAVQSRLDLLTMQRGLRAQAARLRQKLELAAKQARVRCTFRTVRGQVAQELLSAARESDLLIVGRACASKTGRVPLGSTALAVVQSGAQTVLLVHRGAPFRQPLLLLYDGSKNADRMLAAVPGLSGAAQPRLTLLVWAQSEEEARERQRRAARRLKVLGIRTSFEMVTVADAQGLIQAVKDRGPGILLVGAQNPLLKGEKSREILDQIDLPILVIC